MTAGVADHADRADHGALRIAHGEGDGDQTCLDELVVHRPPVCTAPARPVAEVALHGVRRRWRVGSRGRVRGRAHGRGRARSRGRTRRYRGESGVQWVLQVPCPPRTPLRVAPAGGEQRPGRAAFGRQDVTGAERDRHGPPARRLGHEAHAVPVGDGHGHRLVQLVGEGDGMRPDGLGQSGGGEVGVAQLRRARREQQVPLLGPYVPEAQECRGDPVDRRPGEPRGAGEIAGAVAATRPGGHGTQDGEPALQRPDELLGGPTDSAGGPTSSSEGSTDSSGGSTSSSFGSACCAIVWAPPAGRGPWSRVDHDAETVPGAVDTTRSAGGHSPPRSLMNISSPGERMGRQSSVKRVVTWTKWWHPPRTRWRT